MRDPSHSAPTAAGRLPAPPPRWAEALLFVLAAAVFLPTLANGITNFDDPKYLGGHPFANRGFAGILPAWFGTHDDAWYPLTQTVYCVIQALVGPSAFTHHLVQLLVFAGAVALVPRALEAFGLPRRLGFWAALLWAAHPMRVDTVSWAANLNDALSTLGVVAAFALYAGGRKRGAAWVFGAALLAKTRVFPLALLFVFLERQPGESWRETGKRSLPWLVPAAAVAAISALVHLGVPDSGRTMPGGSLFAAIPSALWLPWWYVGRTLLAPAPQVIYSFDAVGWLDLRLLAALALWGGAGFAAYRSRGGRRTGPLALAGFALPFATVTGLVPLMYPVADRYALFPALVVGVVAVIGLDRLAARIPKAAVASVAVLAVATAALGAGSVARQGEWKDSLTLWKADRARNPESAPVRVALNAAYAAQGRWDDAIAELTAIESFAPGRPETAVELFLAQLGKGGVDPRAAALLAAQFRQNRENPEALALVAGMALKEKQLPAARIVIEAALALPENAAVLAAAARIESVSGSHERALAHAERAVAIDPTREDAAVTKAISLAQLKRWDEALAATERPLADTRQQALLTAVRAMVLSATGREAEAKEVLAGVEDQLGINAAR